jgi:dihydrofolate reductase
MQFFEGRPTGRPSSFVRYKVAMAKLIVSEFVTLDGVMEAPGGEEGHPHTGWVFDFVSPEQERYKLEEVMEAEALLLGRVTYEGFAAAWPERGGGFADKMNGMPKHVVSTTLEDPVWSNTSVLRDVKDVAGLKEKDGGPLLVAGSRTLVHSLMEHALVDEYRLMVFPVVLGSGARLFPETPDKTALRLVDTQTFDSGVVVQTYQS